MKQEQLEKIFSQLDKENFDYFYRQRINFHYENLLTGEVVDKLSLNEIFAAEMDSGKTSVYSLEIDGKSIGKFVSSGLIVSTGSGSTAWLQSARRISYSNVRNILESLGAYSNGDGAFQDVLEA